MDFEFYRNFITIAETGNITTAAQKLNLAQPALSAQIKTLEQHYGVTLINMSRGKRQLSLTEAGSSFLSRAREICQTEESLQLEMQSFHRRVSGTLRFSVSYAARPYFVEHYLLPFAQAYPEIGYQLREEAAIQQLNSIKNNSSDIAYANAPLAVSSLYHYKRCRLERFFAVFNNNNALGFAPAAAVTLKNLEGLPLSCNFASYGTLQKLCKKQGWTPHIGFIATTGTAAVQFAMSGTTIAVVSADCCCQLPPDMSKVFIDEEELAFQQTLFWSAQNAPSPAARLFLEFHKDK